MTTDNKTVMFSINKPHTDNIISGKKTSELRKRPPAKVGKYKALIYETKNRGGRGKVIGEFIAINLLCFHPEAQKCGAFPPGALTAIQRRAYISPEEFLNYCAGGKAVTEIRILDLKTYDKPKELSEFGIKRAPQSWCYAKEVT